MKKVVLLVVLAVLAWWYFDGSRRISEEAVRDHYMVMVTMYDEGNAEALCAQMDSDYRVVDVSFGPEDTRRQELDRDSACREVKRALKTIDRLGRVSGGLLTPDLDVQIKGVAISADRKLATVESISTMRLGDSVLVRSRATDRLVRRVGRIRSLGGESKTWVYGN